MFAKKRPTLKLKNILILLISIWLALAFYNSLSQISNWLTSHHFQNRYWDHLRFLTIRVWLPWLALTPIVLALATWFPVKPENWLKALLLHGVLLLSVSFFSGLAISLHYHFFEDMAPGMEDFQPWQHIGHFLFGDNIFLFNTIIYTVIVANINMKNFSKIAENEALIASQLNNQLMESQLQVLKMQINPHFLFNTLNVISVLVMKSEQDKANEMINRLSKFFRQTLDEQENHWLPLRKELDHIDQYLGIEQVRFGERLTIIKNYDVQSLSCPVPSMLLQPLVENAMQHGLGEKEGKGHLTLSSQVINDELVINIIDDGIGCNFDDKKFSEGIGLKNVRSRLQQLYGENFVFTLSNNEQGGITALIKLAINAAAKDEN